MYIFDFSNITYIFSFFKILKQKYGDNQNIEELELDPLMKQIMIFENHSHDNFEEIDAQVENFEGIWDGKLDLKFFFQIYFSISNQFENRH